MAKPKYWIGNPDTCDICSGSLMAQGIMIDGATALGPWANMCEACHKKYGRGLGTGRGQKYTRVAKGCESPMQCEKIEHIPLATIQTLRSLACQDGCERVGRWLKVEG